jgi:hypothetical protein
VEVMGGWAGEEWSRRGRNDRLMARRPTRIWRRQIGRGILVAREEWMDG